MVISVPSLLFTFRSQQWLLETNHPAWVELSPQKDQGHCCSDPPSPGLSLVEQHCSLSHSGKPTHNQELLGKIHIPQAQSESQHPPKKLEGCWRQALLISHGPSTEMWPGTAQQPGLPPLQWARKTMHIWKEPLGRRRRI